MISKDIITRAERNIREAREDPPPVSGDKYAADLMNDLFKSLFAAKPGWRASFPNIKDAVELDAAVNLLKKTWIKAFAENGINTKEQIQAAMRKVRKDPNKFLPSVGEFMEWTQPDPTDYGLPDAESAYREACDNCHRPSRHKWSHNVVYAAGCIVQWFNLRTQSGKEDMKNTKRSYLRAYQEACKDVMEGKTINGPQVVERGLEQHSQGESVNTSKNIAAKEKAMQELKGL